MPISDLTIIFLGRLILAILWALTDIDILYFALNCFWQVTRAVELLYHFSNGLIWTWFFFFLLFNVISVNSEYFKMLLEGSPMVQGVTSELWSFQFKTPGFRTLHFSEAFSDLRVKLKTKTITMIFFPHFLKSLVIHTEKNPI